MRDDDILLMRTKQRYSKVKVIVKLGYIIVRSKA